MAERRMFAKSIINSARFLRMPSSSRLLYYDLGMAADDDGIVEAFTVMRTTGATEDDLRVLVTKDFVKVLNDDLVTFICDWKRNNQIKNDRYHPSTYANLLIQINDGTSMEPTWNPHGTERVPQVRLGKDSIVKGSVDGVLPEAKPVQRKRFTPPTVNQVSEFVRENGLNNVDPQRFVDFYASKGWVVGKSGMKDWKAACRNWNRNDRERPKPSSRIESDVADLDNLYA